MSADLILEMLITFYLFLCRMIDRSTVVCFNQFWFFCFASAGPINELQENLWFLWRPVYAACSGPLSPPFIRPGSHGHARPTDRPGAPVRTFPTSQVLRLGLKLTRQVYKYTFVAPWQENPESEDKAGPAAGGPGRVLTSCL